MSTHTINVSTGHADHWSYSTNGGTETHVATGVLSADVTLEDGNTTITVKAYGSGNEYLNASDSMVTTYTTQPTSLTTSDGGTVSFTSWSSDISSGSNDRSYNVCYPNHWKYTSNTVNLPATLTVPDSGNTTLATFYAPVNVGSGNPALTLAEWQEYQAFVDSGTPFVKKVGRNMNQNHNLGPYASGATVFKCGLIGWSRGRTNKANPNLTAAVTLSVTSDGDIISSRPDLFDTTSLMNQYNKNY